MGDGVGGGAVTIRAADIPILRFALSAELSPRAVRGLWSTIWG